MIDRWRLEDAAATEQLGAALALACPWSDRAAVVLWLRGELGAGKTTVAAGLLAALGVAEAVRSPSYALMELYAVADARAVHLDLYRLQGTDEVQALGLRDYLEGRTLILIEWPERAERELPPADVEVVLEYDSTGRRAQLLSGSATGERWLSAVHKRAAGADLK